MYTRQEKALKFKAKRQSEQRAMRKANIMLKYIVQVCTSVYALYTRHKIAAREWNSWPG